MSFIYGLEDWPDFRWDAALLEPDLAAVRYRQGRLLGRMDNLGFDLRSDAVLRTLTEDVVKTSEIEGEFLDRQQVRSSLAKRLGLDVAGLVPADRHVDGVVDMLLDATQHFDQPLTAERLFAWHAALFPTGRSGLRRIRVGIWRADDTGPMEVVSGRPGRERVHFRAPDAAQVPSAMQRFLAWFEDPALRVDPIVKAAVAHIWFVTIHPFEDGNGRIGRAIIDLILARSEGTSQRFYSMSGRLRAERKDYYDTLEAAQRGTLDITTSVAWFLRVLGNALDDAEGLLDDVLKKARFWSRLAEQPVNTRQRQILNRLLDGFEGKLTSSKYAKLAKCSQATALRDIDDLVRQDVLQRNEGGGRSVSYFLAAVGPQSLDSHE